MTLKDYYEKLPDWHSAPKIQFRDQLVKECGVSVMTVYRWFSGECVPDKLKREKVAELTGIPVEELFPKQVTE